MLVPPGAVDVDIHQNREGRAHPSPFTVTRLHALFPACKFDRPLIVEALARLRSRSCIIDGEAVACDGSGIAQINRIRYRSYDSTVLLYAFDLIELNGNGIAQFIRPCLASQSLISLAMSSEFLSIIIMCVLPLMPIAGRAKTSALTPAATSASR